MIKNFFKDFLVYIPAQIAPGIVGFITIPIVTKLFPPESYGDYSLVMATVTVLATIVGWLPMSIIRFYPAYEKENKSKAFIGSVIQLTIISVLVISLLAVIFLLAFKNHLSSQLYFLGGIGIGVFFGTGVFDSLQHFLRATRKVAWYSGFAVWKSLGGLIFALVFIFLLRRGIESLLWGAILALLVVLPPLGIKTLKGISLSYFKIIPSMAIDMAKYSFPLVVGNLAAWILNLSDRYILQFYRGSQEVGIYAASYNITNRSVLLLTTLFILAASPITMHIWEKDGEEQSKEWVSKLSRYLLLGCIPFAVGLSVLSKPIIKIMTGEQYYEGYRIIPLVTVGILFLGFQRLFQVGFLFYKKTGYITLAIIISSSINVILNFIFIPKYGYFAAAITTLASYTMLLLLMIVFSQHLFTWNFPFRSLLKASIAAALMGIAVALTANTLKFPQIINLILCFFLGVLIYCTLLFLFKEFLPEEKKFMNQIIEKLLTSQRKK